MLAPETWIPLGQIGRAHGVRGEVRVHSFNRDSDVLRQLERVLVRWPSGRERELLIQSTRPTPQAILAKFDSIEDRDAADELRGATVCARRRDLPPPAEGEFYACDLEGARVVVDDGEAVRTLGRVRTLRTYPSADALLVDADDGGPAFEVPLVGAIVRHVDVVGGLITLGSLEGVERE